MRSDLDQIMNAAGVDALWVSGNLFDNPDMVYLTSIQHVNNADLFKIKGKSPVLFHLTDMEREEAAKTGLRAQSYFSDVPLSDYLKQAGGDVEKALALRMREALASIGLTRGTVAISGRVNIGPFFAVLEQLKMLLPDLKIKSFFKDSPFLTARMTKTEDEVEHIRRMGQITTTVMGRVQRFLQSCPVENEQLRMENGTPLTIRDVKNRINYWLAELGADNPEETIFSIGRDGGVPHNSGNPDDAITLGVPIVFDIFPCEKGGGYFYDCTRTWCLGHAPDAVRALYNDVLDVHHQVISSLKTEMPFTDYQTLTCDLFAQLGHITIAEDENTQAGYLHSVGHGVGLDVHEKPFSGATAAMDDILTPGVVFTIEPGLYYPEQGVGVRIEDTIYLNQAGNFEVLAQYPYDLVIPMEKRT